MASCLALSFTHGKGVIRGLVTSCASRPDLELRLHIFLPALNRHVWFCLLRGFFPVRCCNRAFTCHVDIERAAGGVKPGVGVAAYSNMRALATNGTNGVPVGASRKPPKDLREAIEAGDVLAVGAFVRAMSQEDAEVDLIAQDR